jgi:glutathione peroxidase
MNALVDDFGDKLAVLAVPSNQFGHQTNENDAEFVNTLKHVRPGNGFEFKGELFACSKVNGAKQLPLFKWMKETKPIPFNTGKGDTKENGCNDEDALILPRGAFDSTTITLWSPVARSDIAWNFEKFLIGPDGKLVERFGRYFPTADLKPHIQKALDNC